MSVFTFILVLVGITFAATFLIQTFLMIGALPGALLSQGDEENGGASYVLLIVGQLLAYTSYSAMLLSWCIIQCEQLGISKIWVLPLVVIFAIVGPVAKIRRAGLAESAAQGKVGPAQRALEVSGVLGAIVTVVFALFPMTMLLLWGWLPFVGSIQ